MGTKDEAFESGDIGRRDAFERGQTGRRDAFESGQAGRRDAFEREAFERGRREAFTTAEIDSHERRLNLINGSIEKHAREAVRLRNSISGLSDKVDALAASLATKAAVEADRDRQLKRANDQQISNRTFWLGVATIMVTLLIAVVSSHIGVFR